MTQAGYYIAAAILAALIVVIANHGQPPPLEQKRKYGVVSFVIDGETIILKGAQPNIRLWGVDAAEKDEQGFRCVFFRLFFGFHSEKKRQSFKIVFAVPMCAAFKSKAEHFSRFRMKAFSQEFVMPEIYDCLFIHI